MGNEKNLIPNSERTPQQLREQTRKAGIASGEARRRRKTLKEELLALLSDGDMQERLSLALIDEALNGNKAGSVTKAFEVIRDTIGEKPTEKVEVGKIDKQQSMKELQDIFADDDERRTSNN